jgi:integrase-like protein
VHTLILDNGPQYTATASVLYAHELGLVPITTLAYSPESNGLAEGFVHTFKRDYVNVHELRDAESVLAQLGGWIDDYNRQAPHSAPGCGAQPTIGRWCQQAENSHPHLSSRLGSRSRMD